MGQTRGGLVWDQTVWGGAFEASIKPACMLGPAPEVGANRGPRRGSPPCMVHNRTRIWPFFRLVGRVGHSRLTLS